MRYYSIDNNIFWVAVILITMGIMILADVSAPISQIKFGYPTHFLWHQIVFGLIPGIILSFFFFKVSLEWVKKYSFLFFLIAVLLSAAIFLPYFGAKAKGAVRWLSIGPFSFQPSEFLKLFFIVFLAYWFSRKDFKKIKNFLWFLVFLGFVSAILYFQKDLSTLAIILVTSFTMYFLADSSWGRILLIIAFGAIILFTMVKLEPYRFNRLLVLFNPQVDPLGIGYQAKQALITVGSGGILGQGLGLGKQKFGFLPESMSDSVFAILAEEAGFIGSIFIIFLFILLFCRGFLLARKSKEKFVQLLVYGVSIWLIFQSAFNIGGMIHLFPLAGIPLPFISYGGSHLIAELIGIGLLLNASKYSII